MKKTKNKQKQKNILKVNFFHRINPNAKGFDIFVEFSKIQITSLNQMTKNKKTRKQNKRTIRQNKRTRKQNRRTKEQVCKIIIELHVRNFYAIKTHQVFC